MSAFELKITALSAKELRQCVAEQLTAGELLAALRARMRNMNYTVQVQPFETPEGMEDAPYGDPPFLACVATMVRDFLPPHDRQT
jgi:hypothetical protein